MHSDTEDEGGLQQYVGVSDGAPTTVAALRESVLNQDLATKLQNVTDQRVMFATYEMRVARALPTRYAWPLQRYNSATSSPRPAILIQLMVVPQSRRDRDRARSSAFIPGTLKGRSIEQWCCDSVLYQVGDSEECLGHFDRDGHASN